MKKFVILLSKILEGAQRKQSSKGNDREIAKKQIAAADMVQVVAEQGEVIANLKLDLAKTQAALIKAVTENNELRDEVLASKLKLKELASIFEIIVYGIIFTKNFVEGSATGYAGLCATAGLYSLIALVTYVVSAKHGGEVELYGKEEKNFIRIGRYVVLGWNIAFSVAWVVYLSGTTVWAFPVLTVVNAAFNTLKAIIHFIFSEAEISHLEKKCEKNI